MNTILFIAIYCTISITLTSLIYYKIFRPSLYEKHGMPPPKKMRWQTIFAVFLLHIFTALIAIAVFPYLDSDEENTILICRTLSVLLYLLYTAWYFVNHRLYEGVDFISILVILGFFYIPIYFLKSHIGLYYEAWCNAMFFVQHTFGFASVFLIYIIYCIYGENTRKTIRRLWDGGDSND